LESVGRGWSVGALEWFFGDYYSKNFFFHWVVELVLIGFNGSKYETAGIKCETLTAEAKC